MDQRIKILAKDSTLFVLIEKINSFMHESVGFFHHSFKLCYGGELVDISNIVDHITHAVKDVDYRLVECFLGLQDLITYQHIC